MKFLTAILLIVTCVFAYGQNGEVVKGNRYFKEGKLDKAEESYRKASSKQQNPVAQYNLGNTLYKKEKTQDAIDSYDASAGNTTDLETKAKALYNKGVLYHKNNQLNEAVEAYKEALRLTPADAQIRTNLQLALRKQQEQKPKDNKDQKPKEQPKEEKKQPQEPKPQKSKLTKKQAEQYLKALEQKERELQEKMRKKTGVPSQQEKDW
jgi:Ca-activated chloride channel homolog